jgi:hypothetical protein
MEDVHTVDAPSEHPGGMAVIGRSLRIFDGLLPADQGRGGGAQDDLSALIRE